MKGWMGLVCYEQAGSCPQWPPTHCACSSCSPVVTSPHLDTQPQPCPTSSQTRPATASPSPRLSTSASCWPSCCGWPGSPVSQSSRGRSLTHLVFRRLFLWALSLLVSHYRWSLCCRSLSPNSVDQKSFQSFPADFLLIWSLNRRSEEGKFLCDFSSQKVWILLWQVMNILGVCGLVVALGE